MCFCTLYTYMVLVIVVMKNNNAARKHKRKSVGKCFMKAASNSNTWGKLWMKHNLRAPSQVNDYKATFVYVYVLVSVLSST